jgi:hypothetical protein
MSQSDASSVMLESVDAVRPETVDLHLESVDESGFVVEWQLLPLAEEPPVKNRRKDKTATVRLVELRWQG